MGTGFQGTYVIKWHQITVSGNATGTDDISEGSVLSWDGQAVRLDGPPSVLLLGDPLGQAEMRRRAGRAIRRLTPGVTQPVECEDDPDALPENSFMVTDGEDRYTLILIDTGSVVGPLLLFEDGVPPANTPLRVIRTQGDEAPITRHTDASERLICFTSGTMIQTPDGPRPVEDLSAGDLVATKDSGAQEIRWIGSRHITGARLFAMPDLRPVRIRAGALCAGRPDQDLLVSPEHRILYSGPNAEALFNTPEVLVCARDLINDRSVTVDHTIKETTYVHLLLDRQEILWANGIETESFHPGTASLDMIDPGQCNSLLAMYPELQEDTMSYGDFARRLLLPTEAEILLCNGAARH